MPIAFVSAWFCNICYAQSFLHYVNFYVNLVPRSLHQRRRWGEGKGENYEEENPQENTYFYMFQTLPYYIEKVAENRRRAESQEKVSTKNI